MTATVHHFSVTDFHAMAYSGVFGPDDRVELLEGTVYNMAPIGPVHAALVERVAEALRRAVGSGAQVRVQNPVVLDDHSEPIPDIAVVEARGDYYVNDHPSVGAIFLLVEVTDSSSDRDRTLKLPRYAAAGVAEVWLVDVTGSITVFFEPVEGTYTGVNHMKPPLVPIMLPHTVVTW